MMVKKKALDGQPQPLRWCGDFRALNNSTKDDGYPVPSMSYVIDAAAQVPWRSKLDLLSGYWQIPIAPEDVHKTAVATPVGLVEFVRMPFGLKTAPKTFQRMMNTVFAEKLHETALAYLDDLIVYTLTFEEHLRTVVWVLQTAIEAGIRFKATKCEFVPETMSLLGVVLTPEGRTPDQDHVKALRNMEQPRSPKALHRALGMMGFFRDFIPRFALRTAELDKLARGE